MGHGHDHGHDHVPRTGDPNARIRRMRWALLILVGFLVLELTVGLIINSLALLADAGHMVTDVVGMSMGLTALLLARRGSTDPARTFGWHRVEVLSAVANAVLLLGVAAWIMYEAIGRIGEAPDLPGGVLIGTALAGLAANVVVMLMLRGDVADSIAVRGAYLEVLADAVGSVGVLFAGVVTLLFGWSLADVIVGVAISLWVVPRAVRLALSALRILSQTGPAHIDVDSVRRDLHALPLVADVHDLHIWTLTTGKDVATVHLTVTEWRRDTLIDARAVLAEHGLEHATVQLEPREQGGPCKEQLSW